MHVLANCMYVSKCISFSFQFHNVIVMVWVFGLVVVSCFILKGSSSYATSCCSLSFSCFPSLVIVFSLDTFTCLWMASCVFNSFVFLSLSVRQSCVARCLRVAPHIFFYLVFLDYFPCSLGVWLVLCLVLEFLWICLFLLFCCSRFRL